MFTRGWLTIYLCESHLQDTACDLAKIDRFACFGWDKVEWAIRDLDEAVKTNAGGSHDSEECSCC